MKKSPLLVIFLTVFLDLVGFGIILPLMPFYAEHFGANATFIGFFGAAFSAMQFVFSPLLGRLSDRIGRRPVILFGVAGTIVSMLVFAFAPNKWVLLLGRALAGVAGGNIAAAQAYISDVTTPENRSKGMGLIGAAFGLGFIFGPAIGGTLSVFGNHAPGLFAAGLAAVNLVLAAFLLPESLSPELRALARNKPRAKTGRFERIFKQGFSHPDVGALLILFFVVTLAFANLESTFALFTQRRLGFDAKHVGYVFAYIGVIATIIQGGLIGRLTKWLGEQSLLIGGVACLMVGMFLMVFVHGWVMLLVVNFIISVGNGLYNPSQNAMVSKLAAPEDRGSLLGIQASLGALGRMFGPPIGGILFDRFNEDTPYYTGAAMLAVGLLIAVFVVLPRSRVDKEASQVKGAGSEAP